MNRKSIFALLALTALAVSLLLGLPFAANRIIEHHMEQTVTETATPLPIDDDFEP